jgi:hypothetical protein
MNEVIEKMKAELNKSLALIEQNKYKIPEEALDLFRKEQMKGTFDKVDQLTNELNESMSKLNELKI